ncbi:DNA-processing protein DprA [Salipaludibacillus aurantiacus]|uniref:DNA processing protein n=1 Tax=Salipaludibacillus aurantiacus TaxID=1601833 RepID=A0A1H9QM27_9BACI|nr:DNA-processing protein DprA [Salipaludibacillus aurantiacus]SER61498.1 DNA processing protein [Salipaludibacillus aurantiacus]
MFIPQSLSDRLLHLHYSSFGSYSLVKKCLDRDASLEAVYKMGKTEFLRLFPKSDKFAAEVYDNLTKVQVNYLKHEFYEKGIGYLDIYDPKYPALLKEIYDPPSILYYKGHPRILNPPLRLSVVGTRHPSQYAINEMASVLTKAIKYPLTIVSGMALGVDSMAHSLTLKENGLTIAVLAYGVDHLYPSSLKALKETLEKNQLILTEYPPYVKPNRWQFPARNRIISGLSQASFIIEAKQKSGSLITADCAIQQGRDVFALPGRISHSESAGTNYLIQQGAKPILKPEDILEEYI